MPYLDLPLPELRSRVPEHDPPADLAEFWSRTLAEARAHEHAASFTHVDVGLPLIDVFDVRFAGFGGAPIAGWLRLPHGATRPLPTVIQYVGYGGGRGLVHQDLLFAAAGFAHLIVDNRGQGGLWSPGATRDPHRSGAPQVDGVMTDGILAPETYYYRRLITDAVRAVDAARSHPHVDPGRIAVLGGSQGGGLAIATAGLVPGLAAVVADVPFLSDFPRAIRIASGQPYRQIADYLRIHRDRVPVVERTLAYVDAVNLGISATAPALFGVALMDETCPPSTVYAAYNRYGGPKEIVEWPFNDHESGGEMMEAVELAFLRRVLVEA